MSKTEDLIALITRAWQDSEYTDEIHNTLDYDTGHPESQEARQEFKGRKWHEISDDVLLAQCPAPFLIGDNAMLYFLPAFLIAAIRHPDELLMDELIEFHLIPPRKPHKYQVWCAKYDQLTQEQAFTVKQFLMFVRDEHIEFSRTIRRINDAIDRYWSDRAGT